MVSILTIFILVFLTFGCTDNKSEYQNGSNGDAVQPTTTATPEPANLVILDSKLGKEEYGGYIVTGSARQTRIKVMQKLT